jgi:hypothetical protein
MEDLVKLGQVFVQAMRDRRGIAQVDEIYAENAQSVEAVVPPGRDVRIAKGRGAIKAKREDWLQPRHSQARSGRALYPPT